MYRQIDSVINVVLRRLHGRLLEDVNWNDGYTEDHESVASRCSEED